MYFKIPLDCRRFRFYRCSWSFERRVFVFLMFLIIHIDIIFKFTSHWNTPHHRYFTFHVVQLHSSTHGFHYSTISTLEVTGSYSIGDTIQESLRPPDLIRCVWCQSKSLIQFQSVRELRWDIWSCGLHRHPALFVFFARWGFPLLSLRPFTI